jgi:ATP-dependent DNA helicase RecG
LRVGLLHGRMKGPEKEQIMAAFKAGGLDLLVATTVIEVGVDVPNASLMVIEHAERFGLAQLHQLRGRVGRGASESVCILLYAAPLSEGARERLKVVFETSDGFEIARCDLLLRGPGEVLGERQSGVPLLRFADLERDQALAGAAREAAEALLKDDPERARAHVARWLSGRQDLARV